MPDAIAFSLHEAVLSEDELNQRDVLFIKFHMRDIIDDRTDDDDTRQAGEEFLTGVPPQTIESLSIPRQQISNKTELLQNISDVLNRLNVPSYTVTEYAESIYSKAAVSVESNSKETIRPILVNFTFITFVFSDDDDDDDDEDTDELTGRVDNLSVSTCMHASKSSIEALEKVEGSGLKGDCAICMLELSIDSKVIARMPCSHLFHKKCVVEWLEKSHLCPMCRFEMPVDPNSKPKPCRCCRRLAKYTSGSES